jgi:opacity protein-like surface antigen
MRNGSIVAAVLASFLCAGAALAQTVPDTGFYLGLSAGKSHARFKTADFSTGDPSISESANTTDTGYKALIGWSFSRYLAAELSYTSIGRYSYQYTVPGFGTSRVNYDVNAVALSGLGTIPIGKDFSVLLRLGVSANKAERSALNGDFSTLPPVGASNKTRASPMGGLGLQYDVAHNAAVRLEFEYYGLAGDAKGNGIQVTPTANFPDTTGRANIWMFSLGGVMRF